MNPKTRSQYKAFLQQVAHLNHLDAEDVVTRFTVDPSVRRWSQKSRTAVIF
ncbi:hypothetical protein SGGMMB4_04395 [Sodalis glossinidius str. 'morsitans']|uniref:Uncharacterized protein n=1 Tax=Sodalis glossinidius (strain morsitans) TaxID=343509 RepID=A0A193QLW4_SODGM|nr:hypothetical protein SGGMMB4_04395 [Sodalis glossinidius str. 'morsitans']